MRVMKVVAAPAKVELPTTHVRRGKVTVSVAARGDLQGGNTEMVTVPMVGNDSTTITYLRDPGEMVEAGDVIVELDTTQQEYTLREAEADLAEAQQQVALAQANAQAADLDNRLALQQSESDVVNAELEVQRNAVLAAQRARQNEISLESARMRLHQAQQNMDNKSATSTASVAIQQANLNKAKMQAEMVKKIIESMSVKSKTAGYVNIQPNTRGMMMMYTGMMLQPAQVGDTVFSGMAIAQIPDFKSWEVSARVGELDRGHLAVNQKVTVSIVALPGKSFPGHVKLLGGTSGPAWDRRFDCRIELEQPAAEMRPGMTSNMLITAESLDDVLWIPSQALYENGGKTFVYLKTQEGFMPRDVTLVSRSESQAVIKGLNEGDVVAMSNPEQQTKNSAGPQNGAMKALQK